MNSLKQNEAFSFFREHAGYATPPGKLACAKALAEAEQLGEELGLTVVWEPEECWSIDDIETEERWQKRTLRRIELGELEVCRAYVQDYAGNCLASLSMIVAGPHDSYRRVVSAELMQEALEELKKGSAV